MTNEKLAKALHNILSKQDFKDWYDNEFEDYIVGEDNAPTRTQILSELDRYISQELR